MYETATKAKADSDANKEDAKDDASKKSVEALTSIGKESVVYTGTSEGDLSYLIADNGKTVKSSELAEDLWRAAAGTPDLRTALKSDGDVLDFEITTGSANAQDLQTTYDSFKELGNGFSMAFTIKVTDPDNDNANLGSTTITFVNNKEVAAVSTSLNVSFTTPIHVNAGDSAFAQKLTTSVDAKVTNEKGETVKPSKVKPGNFYNNESDAILKNGNTAGVSEKFAGDGLTYYQPVTLEFAPDAVNVISIYNAMKKDGSQRITLNNKDAYGQNVSSANNSITYVREFQVGSGFDNNTDKPDTDDNNNNEDNNNDANIENGVWVEDNANGKVTVGNNVASLYDDNNNLTNRAVAANSAWATDKSRTNSKTGLKQYHVSTHEWVNADDVTFSGDENNGSNALGTISNLTGHHTVDLAGPDGFVYALFSSNGTRSNRGLAGNTSWYTDKSATDGEGNTYYRVSTDEWIRVSDGVSFK
ncbi:hypothetical protein [Companilactobacillus furfuricola]|uniref:hypothetical protein n=1 Tax=Companilactobacillus furfuricola TaxID=1462575 RepID=UPI000F7857E3|nr:hypothetical protein [Companilactobacillus furfuricola]